MESSFMGTLDKYQMKQYDVVALGELLIDFTQSGISEQGNLLLEANPGGAPCNLLAMLTKLGYETAFIGKVGKDFFGAMLKERVRQIGIDIKYLLEDEKVNTTLAFVHTADDGDRDFSFYRNPGADMMLNEDEIQEEMFGGAKIFHFGTLSMTHEGVRQATKKAVEIAKKDGSMISFDPNLREPLWNSLDDARQCVDYGMRQCDILKISDNEIQWFTQEKDYDKGVKILQDLYHIPLILVSMGKEGSRAYCGSTKVQVKAFLQEKTIETTGAGDTFGACALHYVLQYGIENLTSERLIRMLTFANAAASIVTTRKGALAVMPEPEEVKQFIADCKHI